MVLKGLVPEDKVKCRLSVVAAVMLLISATPVLAQPIFSEDFESYETMEDVLAAGWSYVGVNPEFELRSGDGKGALGSNKWIANVNTTTESGLVWTFPEPRSTEDSNNFHFYTRAADWYRSQSGVYLRNSSDYKPTVGIGTQTGGLIRYQNIWVAEVQGVPYPGLYALNNLPARDPNIWIKLEMHQNSRSTWAEVNDVRYYQDLGYVKFPSYYTMVAIGYGKAFQVVEYDNIYVWSGPDTGVVDWDLY